MKDNQNKERTQAKPLQTKHKQRRQTRERQTGYSLKEVACYTIGKREGGSFGRDREGTKGSHTVARQSGVVIDVLKYHGDKSRHRGHSAKVGECTCKRPRSDPMSRRSVPSFDAVPLFLTGKACLVNRSRHSHRLSRNAGWSIERNRVDFHRSKSLRSTCAAPWFC